MHYTGIDYHKRYSVACTLDVQGNLLKQARIDRNDPAALAAYFAALDGPSEAVIEACWNWATLYDLLEDTKGVAKVVLSNPARPEKGSGFEVLWFGSAAAQERGPENG